jgi:4-amino-4-deoxy-L-arabinose transferase-like glycosyltransferase
MSTLPREVQAAGSEEVPRGRVGRARRALARVPLAAWACALIAAVNGVCWAATTPPYWIPDEIAGIGYVQYLAENGDLPRSVVGGTSSAEQFSLPFYIQGRPSWLAEEDRLLFEKYDRDLARTADGQATYLSGYPPLYYAIDAIPYRIAYGADFPDRIFVMRLLSPLLAALTVLFAFMFVRELLPTTPWAWTVAGLAVAFQPMFGFMSGGVNNDNLLYAASAALFFLMARAFRRGLDLKLGVAIGLTIAVGLLTKQTLFGLLPGVALGLALIIARLPRGERAQAVKGGVAAALIGLLPWAAWVVTINFILERGTSVTGGVGAGTAGVTPTGHLSYLWQSFLPKLPFMSDFFPFYLPWEIYFQGFIGRFGWAEYSFPLNWQRAAFALFAMLTVLAGVELWRKRDVLRSRWIEPLTYGTMFVGLLLLIALAAYRYQVVMPGTNFEQGRYLLPLLGLYAAFIALAVRGAGRKWGPALGAFLIVLAMGHSLFAMLLTISRFYG